MANENLIEVFNKLIQEKNSEIQELKKDKEKRKNEDKKKKKKQEIQPRVRAISYTVTIQL